MKKKIIGEFVFKIYEEEGERKIETRFPKRITMLDMDNIYSYCKDVYDIIRKDYEEKKKEEMRKEETRKILELKKKAS